MNKVNETKVGNEFCNCDKINSFVNKISDKGMTVLITGESGCGKSQLARKIHQHSRRSEKPFVEVHCTTIPHNLLESELFGHLKGAFTGATAPKEGKVQLSHGGTLFLDEIGELPLESQGKLLRLIQDKVVCRLGSNKDEKVDTRIILATNKKLDRMVERGQFREDLYFRINMFQCALPTLRERRDDILKFAECFMHDFDPDREFEMSADLAVILRNYPWPGNIRELKNVIDRLCFLAEGPKLSVQDLPEYILKQVAPSNPSAVQDSVPQLLSLKEVERKYILEILKTQPCLDKAASVLGITKVTLWRKRKEYSQYLS